MKLIEARMVRTFRFRLPDDMADQLMRMYSDANPLDPNVNSDPLFDSAFSEAKEAFDSWKATEEANAPFCFDEIADCVLGSDVLHGFEIIPESERFDGTIIV